MYFSKKKGYNICLLVQKCHTFFVIIGIDNDTMIQVADQLW